jgi:hypothetical protein
MSLALGSFVNIRGFTLGTSHHVVIITWSLAETATSLASLQGKIFSSFSIIIVTYSHGVGCFKPVRSLRQTMWFPPPPHDLPRQLVHVFRNIFQHNSITGSGKVTKLTQLLTSFTVQHVKDALDTQDGEVVVKPPDSVRHSLHLPDHPLNHLLYLCTFVGEQ